jgi:hypothetical protein
MKLVLLPDSPTLVFFGAMGTAIYESAFTFVGSAVTNLLTKDEIV